MTPRSFPALVFFAFALYASGVHAQSPAPHAVDVAATASAVVEQTNALRRAEGLSAVRVDAKLQAAAREFAGFMARTGKYGHEADGRDPPARAQAHGYAYCLVLENIAYHYDSRGFDTRPLAQLIVKGWQESPPHRKNLINPLVTHIGVAVARSPSNGYYYTVQMFGLPRSASVKFEVRNESRETVRYRVGDEPYTVPARSMRTHEICGRETVTFEALSGGESWRPKTGDRFVVPAQGDRVTVRRR